ncbi:hypothetical protein CDV26_05755 [Francisella halioticida]|uniref:Pyridine nucleotide-disulfide oxidoreductase n=1 Tax=Francisella halioticida TaxID=549298 RepID=A0ABN5AVP0_9GAMM|nr:hypothetical protein [Francisella halioticida]ASG67954.1 hypothetical protein CDV26_05755 [Francisella halioticida]
MRRVAIIGAGAGAGAGASGLISAKVFLDKGFDVIVLIFENELVSYNANRSFINYDEVKTYLEANARAWQVYNVPRKSY